MTGAQFLGPSSVFQVHSQGTGSRSRTFEWVPLRDADVASGGLICVKMPAPINISK